MEDIICPECNSKNIREGQQMGQGSISFTSLGFSGSSIVHVFCADCGLIIKSRVKNLKHAHKAKPYSLT